MVPMDFDAATMLPAVEDSHPTTASASASPSLSVLLGANGSGKSTYLHTIGIVAYLAHIGSYVPCQDEQLQGLPPHGSRSPIGGGAGVAAGCPAVAPH